jgi:hypothetical protein
MKFPLNMIKIPWGALLKKFLVMILINHNDWPKCNNLNGLLLLIVKDIFISFGIYLLFDVYGWDIEH